MTTTIRSVEHIEPIDHHEARSLARTAYARFADVLATVSREQWDRPTDCEGWTVRHLGGHMVGAMRSAASFRELLRQQREISRRVKADGGDEVDHMTQLQIDLTADLSADELVAECRSLVEPAAKGRARTPAPIRRFVKVPVVIGDQIDEKWTIGYLVDVILTRDAWLHRIDLCRAIGVEPVLTPDHDGRIIADVVAEWARRHAQPFDLVLTGPAGDSFTSGPRGRPLTLDAVEFCRIVSGRATGDGLLETEVPF